MTTESKKESEEEVKSENLPLQSNDLKTDQTERRSGPSKCEIMEELSRQRFPWDD